MIDVALNQMVDWREARERAHREKDDEVLASILAGSALTQRPLEAGRGFFGTIGFEATEDAGDDGPCCAIGAGVLYAGLDPNKVKRSGALRAFARHYDVSMDYAVGVSDGFETNDAGFVGSVSRVKGVDKSSSDYARGFAVGAAVRASLYPAETLIEAVRS